MKTQSVAESPSRGASPRNPVSTLPAAAGISLKPEYFRDILETRPAIGFLEIHAENYLVDGGPYHHYLTRIREQYPLSIHGVGLSIGGEEPLNIDHLDQVAKLIERYQPAIFSEHLAWSGHGGRFLNDLLPLPYNRQSLQRVCDHIDLVQSRLKRRILLENPATYIEFAASPIPETEFIDEILRRTGCGLLLDVNNVHVSCTNHDRDAIAWLESLRPETLGQIHLAGFAEERDSAGAPLLIDSHDAPVDEAVWSLYDRVLARCGPLPTLIERDGNLPPLPVLLDEAEAAQRRLLSAPSRERRP
ncbi:DUF692 domain-containing protein [Marinobacterium aestuariivivens]|uniref:UPF0276 protein ACFQDL_30505 n=1 Tax=Marinobacterium aestuariivivens TaxID=1698799 RepID=A0ABW2A915_9GAMM